MKLFLENRPFPSMVTLLLEIGDWVTDGGETSWPECERYLATSAQDFPDGSWHLENEGLIIPLRLFGQNNRAVGEHQAVFIPRNLNLPAG